MPPVPTATRWSSMRVKFIKFHPLNVRLIKVVQRVRWFDHKAIKFIRGRAQPLCLQWQWDRYRRCQRLLFFVGNFSLRHSNLANVLQKACRLKHGGVLEETQTIENRTSMVLTEIIEILLYQGGYSHQKPI